MSKSKPTNGTAPDRPALRYPGAKWTLGPWIVSNLPIAASDSYTEAYGGSAGVLLQKPPQRVETWNDLNGALVNYFKVLRESPGKLIRLIRLTPHARTEFELSKVYEEGLEPLEWARRTFVFYWMSISGGREGRSRGSAGGWRSVKGLQDRYSPPSEDVVNINHLYAVANRFKGVQIESLPALELLTRYDNPLALHYVDPPYHPDTRTEKTLYRHEMNTEQQHLELLALLMQLKGFVVLSGYDHPLYNETLSGWHRLEQKTRGNSAAARVESLWFNPRAWEARPRAKQLNLGGM